MLIRCGAPRGIHAGDAPGLGKYTGKVIPMGKPSLSRRDFLRRATTAGAVLALPNILVRKSWAQGTRADALNRLTVGVIGVGGRGRDDMRAFMAQRDTQVVAVCDCFADRQKQAVDMVNQAYGNQDCKSYLDMMEILNRKDIDAVLIATGDNWHSGISILAARAGKDIYCEKPLSVCMSESRAVADEVRRLGRVFQCGTQRRSIGHFRYAVHLAQTGKLGELKELHAEEAGAFITLDERILPGQPEPEREVFDWNRWLGPAQWRPYNAETPTRGFWSAHVDFSGGSITEWGSHTVDICQWANQSDDTGPVEFWAEGEGDQRRHYAKYANGVKLVIRRGLRFGSCPVRFEGTEGWVETGDSGEIETYPKSLLGNRGFEGGYPQDNHVRAFLDCVKTREQTNANAEVAHRSISVCHVANMVKRLGRPIKWDPAKEEAIGDAEANRLRSRAYREPWYL